MSVEAQYWLMKSEPNVFSFDDLLRAPKRRTCWEGVRNYQARNLLRDAFRVGQLGLFYHSNADPTAVVGVLRVVREAYADASAFDPKSPYYDANAKRRGKNPWLMVDVEAVAPFLRPVTRPMLAADPRLANMMVLRRGARLSVQPVTESEFRAVCELGGLDGNAL
jgi:predicted RNA-binding protein with PUA-like domain